MNAETVTFFEDIAGVSASIITRRYRRYTSAQDLVQEAWVWALERPVKFDGIMAEEDEGERARRLRNALCNHLDKVARRVKAGALGYEADDEFFYSLGHLRALLPDVYEPALWTSFSASEHEVSAKSDPAEGGNRVTELSDVSVALGRLAKGDQRILFLRYGAGDSEEDIALNLGIDAGAAHMRLERALGRLRLELGGPSPRVDQAEHTGTRRVISNAHAQAITGER